MNRNMLKEAIAEAKTIKESAIANAKLALEETFAPHLKTILASKLEEMETSDLEEDEILRETDDLNMEDDFDLEEVLRELNEEEDKKDSTKETETETETETKTEDEDEDFNIEEMTDEDLKAFIENVVSDMISNGELPSSDTEPIEGEELDLDIEDDEELDLDIEDDEAPVDENAFGAYEDDENLGWDDEDLNDKPKNNNLMERRKLRKDLNEALKVIGTLKREINEVNLLNAKLLYSNKIFKSKSLNEAQKIKVLKAMDRAKTSKDAKIIFETLNENLHSSKPIKNKIMGSASQLRKPLHEQKEKVLEPNEMVQRFQKLAGIK